MPESVVINDTDDVNNLNRDSLLFARYFCRTDFIYYYYSKPF